MDKTMQFEYYQPICLLYPLFDDEITQVALNMTESDIVQFNSVFTNEIKDAMLIINSNKSPYDLYEPLVREQIQRIHKVYDMFEPVRLYIDCTSLDAFDRQYDLFADPTSITNLLCTSLLNDKEFDLVRRSICYARQSHLITLHHLYAYDKADLQKAAMEMVRRVDKYVKDHPDEKVRREIYIRNRETEQYNQVCFLAHQLMKNYVDQRSGKKTLDEARRDIDVWTRALFSKPPFKSQVFNIYG